MSWKKININEIEHFLPFFEPFLNSNDFEQAFNKIISKNKTIFLEEFKRVFTNRELQCAKSNFFEKLLNFSILSKIINPIKAYTFTAKLGYTFQTSSYDASWYSGDVNICVMDNIYFEIKENEYSDLISTDEYNKLYREVSTGTVSGVFKNNSSTKTSGMKKIYEYFKSELYNRSDVKAHNVYLKDFSRCYLNEDFNTSYTTINVSVENIGKFNIQLHVEHEEDNFGNVINKFLYFKIQKDGPINIEFDEVLKQEYDKKQHLKKEALRKTVIVFSVLGIIINTALAVCGLLLSINANDYSVVWVFGICSLVSIIAGILRIRDGDELGKAIIINLICIGIQVFMLSVMI